MTRVWLNLFPVYAAILLLIFVHSSITYAQNAPPFPERQWLGPGEQRIKRDPERFHAGRFRKKWKFRAEF
jgi:hypothetical protein